MEEARVRGEREQRRLAIKDREKEWMSERVQRKWRDRGGEIRGKGGRLVSNRRQKGSSEGAESGREEG